MKSIKNHIKRHWFIVVIAMITLLAFYARFVYCHWGYPLRLQPDEHAIVDKAMEMLSRHSWEADQYNRPDHFEIKCNSIIFTILSWIKFHKPAYEAFEEYTTFFYLRARYFTAVYGTALVPLVGLLAGLLAVSFETRYKRIIQIFSMVFVAFPEAFIENSSFATPDIVLTFFVVIFSYFSVLYLRDGNQKHLYYCMVIIGIGITIKYPAAILMLPFACMFLDREFLSNKPWKNHLVNILKYGIISAGAIFVTIFIIAPNLITNLDAVIKSLRMEARDYHVGSDGFGFLGNLKFYFTFIAADLGTISVIPFFVGLVYVLVRRNRERSVLLIGLIYWVCMSVLSLHWVRWGLPMFVFFILIAAIGIGVSIKFFDDLSEKQKILSSVGKICLCLFLCLLTANIGLTALAKVKYSTIPDTRLITQTEIPELGVTAENSAFEPYTPFAVNGSGANAAIGSFHFTDSGLEINIEHALKKYYVSTNSYRDRYFAEPEKYPELVELYNALDSAYSVIYTITADGNYFMEGNVFRNIPKTLNYLRGHQRSIGVDMAVYDLAPDPAYILISSPAGKYLSVDDTELDLNGDYYPQISDEPFLWVQYDLKENDKFAILSSRSGWAVDTMNPDFSDGVPVRLYPANGNASQQWKTVQDGDYVYILCGDQMALTRDRNDIILAEYNSSPEQQWIIRRHYVTSAAIKD